MKESEVQKNSGSERYGNCDDDEVGKKRNVKENWMWEQDDILKRRCKVRERKKYREREREEEKESIKFNEWRR